MKDVSFDVPRGAIKAVIGPNGAGKTTLFNLIAGTLAPHAGEVLLRRPADHRAASPTPSPRWASPAPSRPPSLFPHMTVLENVMVGRHPRTRSGFLAGMLNLPRTWRGGAGDPGARPWRSSRTWAWPPAPARRPRNLSFGRQRLVEFARALATEPALLLLDEPAAGLNIYETEELAALIRRIRDRGITCLVVEHDMSLVMNISDEVVVLDQGQKIAEGPPADDPAQPRGHPHLPGGRPCLGSSISKPATARCGS